MKLILATKNLHKANEVKSILGDGYEIITLDEANIDAEIIEDGETFEENAVKKAAAIAKLTKTPVIADDSGLMVDYLSGCPGVKTARYAGENASDDENIDKLLNELYGVAFPDRTAKFVCVIALARSDNEVVTFRGECKGYILSQREGENGFGYDPVFYYPSYDISFAKLVPHIKNAVSHRASAIRKLLRYIQSN